MLAEIGIKVLCNGHRLNLNKGGDMNKKLSDLEQAYSPSTAARGYEQTIKRYASESAQALRDYPSRQVAYGTDPEEYALLFEPVQDKANALLVFIHGGYWQELSAFESCFMAGAFMQNGWSYAAVNYTLAPHASVAHMVKQCAAAIYQLHLLQPERTLVIAGSSAGAHLCAMMMSFDWCSVGAATCPVTSGILVSGVYDLRPLVDTYINAPLFLNESSASAISPLLNEAVTPFPVTVCYGEYETQAFKDQSVRYAEFLRQHEIPADCYEVVGVDHFDILFEFNKPESKLHKDTLIRCN
ncbi:alpha/beta hydrolase fold protein [compost metagenome]